MNNIFDLSHNQTPESVAVSEPSHPTTYAYLSYFVPAVFMLPISLLIHIFSGSFPASYVINAHISANAPLLLPVLFMIFRMDNAFAYAHARQSALLALWFNIYIAVFVGLVIGTFLALSYVYLGQVHTTEIITSLIRNPDTFTKIQYFGPLLVWGMLALYAVYFWLAVKAMTDAAHGRMLRLPLLLWNPTPAVNATA